MSSDIKKPFIPLYIGDWEQDVNSISLEAEGALLKLSMKLWKTKPKGIGTFTRKQLTILFKCDEVRMLNLTYELKDNDVLNVNFNIDESITFESRRYTKEAKKSGTAATNGSLRGQATNGKIVANGQQMSDSDIDNDIFIIISYLNNILNTSYSEKTQKNISLIKARYNEGFKSGDFFKVIDTKFAEWGQDDRMRKYLRPETLFGNKFEGYLQQIKIIEPVKLSPEEIITQNILNKIENATNNNPE